MQKILLEALVYVIDHPALTVVVIFGGGFLASRIVLADRRPGIFGFIIIGSLGFFLSRFVISSVGWNEYLDSLLALRAVIEFLAACVGSFVVAGTVHFLKPS